MLLRPQVVWATLATASLYASKAAMQRSQRASLAGVWAVELRVERAAPSNYPKVGRGTITLRPMAQVGVDSAHSYEGVATLDLPPLDREPIRIDSATRARLRLTADWWRRTEAEAGVGDSVYVIVNPGLDHGGLHMRGRRRGAELTGRWEIPGYMAIASGTFTMRRDTASRAP